MFEKESDFDNLYLNPFSEQESILLNGNYDPDNSIFKNLNASYLSEEGAKIKLSAKSNNAHFSILH